MTARLATQCLLLTAFVCLASQASNVWAQFGGGPFGNNFGSAVGGVSINPAGVLSEAGTTLDRDLARQVQQAFRNSQQAPDFRMSSDFRVISLKGLEAALTETRDKKTELAPELAYMAGLQRIEYVMVSPDQNDIWIAGPAEAWQLNDQGIVVGIKSGTPVIHLEDFLAAMRSSENSRIGQGISVSIDPTQEGVRRLQQLFTTMRNRGIPFQPALQQDVETAMGEQIISLTGIPQDSRFAQILVAADYRMKRMSMGFDRSPVDGMPSVMEMLAARQHNAGVVTPRFWMECFYQPVAKADNGSAWQLKGQGVRTLTEESRFDRLGNVQSTGKSNPSANRWAELMTEKFEQISTLQPIFRELRNVMDMSVIAALIARENLLAKSNLELPVILGKVEDSQLPSWNVPQRVATHCGFVRSSNSANPSWLVSASGGIQLDPWSVVENTEIDPALSQLAQAASQDSSKWWWDATIR
jgi:hypothetical protein